MDRRSPHTTITRTDAHCTRLSPEQTLIVHDYHPNRRSLNTSVSPEQTFTAHDCVPKLPPPCFSLVEKYFINALPFLVRKHLAQPKLFTDWLRFAELRALLSPGCLINTVFNVTQRTSDESLHATNPCTCQTRASSCANSMTQSIHADTQILLCADTQIHPHPVLPTRRYIPTRPADTQIHPHPVLLTRRYILAQSC